MLLTVIKEQQPYSITQNIFNASISRRDNNITMLGRDGKEQ